MNMSTLPNGAMREDLEEMLEMVWTQRELGLSSLDALVKRAAEKEGDKVEQGELVVAQLTALGLVKKTGDALTLTDHGETEARTMIRRHRLAERLLVDLLEVRGDAMEESACRFEHVLNVSVTGSVCTLLGHPPTCPHGKPIPRGECCSMFKKSIDPLIVNLRELPIGEKGRVTFIVPRIHARMDKLSSLGLVPGSVVRLHQRRPSYVVEIDETTLALYAEIAEEIYVRRLD